MVPPQFAASSQMQPQQARVGGKPDALTDNARQTSQPTERKPLFGALLWEGIRAGILYDSHRRHICDRHFSGQERLRYCFPVIAFMK